MKDFLKYFDKFAFIVLMLLSFTGIVLIYSASHSLEQSHFLKQLLWLLVSLIVFFLVFWVKTETFFNISFAIYVVLVSILVIQIVAGKFISGTRSWIKMGFFYAQISEFIKIPLALYLAKILARTSIIGWRDFFRLFSLLGIPFLLIALQPDLGTAFMLTSFLIVVFLLKRVKLVIIIFSLMVVAAVSFGTWTYVLKPYQQDRIIAFIDPQKYEKSTGYQIIQSKIALGSGGLTGKGYLNGTQSQYKFLPTRHTDFIVPVLGEEFGFLGITFLLLLFFILFYRQFNLKTESDEEFYFAYLFNGLILFQFLINILMTIGLFPVMGIPLPFVSYGGSSLLAFFIEEALIFRIKINTFLNEF